MTIYNITLHI